MNEPFRGPELAKAIAAWSIADIRKHIVLCKSAPKKFGLQLWTVEGAWPPEDSLGMKDFKPRVGRVYCDLIVKGMPVSFVADAKISRTVLATLMLSGVPHVTWVTAYDDAPDDESPEIEYKGDNGERLVKMPGYAGRLWDLGHCEESIDEYIADWSQNDIGTVFYFTNKTNPLRVVIA